MKDDELRDLLSDTVADVEPRYALDEIRARTTPSKRRWPYAASGGFLAVAASVTAFAVLGNDAPPRATDPASGTSSSPSSSPSPSPSPSQSTPSTSVSATALPAQTVAVYFVGSTPDGPRLYREFRPADGGGISDLEASLVAALTSDPQDPDYDNLWPLTGTVLRSAELVDGTVRIDLGNIGTGEPSTVKGRGLSETDRKMAVEQLIYTAQAAVQERLPVQFIYQGNPVVQVLGVPTSEPLVNGPVLDTLALVSLTTPTEGMVVDNDQPLVVEGAGNSFEGNIVTRVTRPDGTDVLAPIPAIAAMGGNKLFPFEATFDISGLEPGQYVVDSRTDDPSGAGLFHEDNRTIQVVD
jgi:hypothetical protein